MNTESSVVLLEDPGGKQISEIDGRRSDRARGAAPEDGGGERAQDEGAGPASPLCGRPGGLRRPQALASQIALPPPVCITVSVSLWLFCSDSIAWFRCASQAMSMKKRKQVPRKAMPVRRSGRVANLPEKPTYRYEKMTR